MKKYLIDYQTGTGNETTETLKMAVKTAIENAGYTQQDIVITENGDEVARLVWYGVEASTEDVPAADFGEFGFYSLNIDGCDAEETTNFLKSLREE